MEHMLAMTSIQLAFLRHADRVKIGCMTGGLHALCASDHSRVWRTASHYAYMQLLTYARGMSMQVKVDSETFDMPGYAIDDTSQYTGKDGVNYVDAAAAWNKEAGTLSIFVINRNEKENYPLSLDIRGFILREETGSGQKTCAPADTQAEGSPSVKHFEIISEDISRITDPEDDAAMAPEEVPGVGCADGIVSTHVKPLSWNVIVVSVL